MIVDTSALIAIVRTEDNYKALLHVILTGRSFLPAPVLVEYERVTSGRSLAFKDRAVATLAQLRQEGMAILPFTAEDADLAAAANARFGTGNGQGGTLNMLDLMVYAVARRMSLPILCTGKDFASTDAAIHPASRTG